MALSPKFANELDNLFISIRLGFNQEIADKSETQKKKKENQITQRQSHIYS